MARGLDDKTVETNTGPSNRESGHEAEKFRINRRSCLRYGLTTVIGAAGAGRAGRARGSTPRTRHGVRFDRVVNAVSDLGADPTGNRPTDGVLQRALGTGTLIEFPPGEYLVTSGIRVTGTDRVGVRGLGATPSDVRLRRVAADGKGQIRDHGPAIVVTGGDGILLENFQVGDRRQPVPGVNVVAQSGDSLEVHRVRQPERWTTSRAGGIGASPDTQLREMRTHTLSPGHLPSSEPSATARSLTVSGIDTPATYTVGVTGHLFSISTNEDQTDVSGRELTTQLLDAATSDTYRFTGDIISFEVLKGAVQPEINDRVYHPANIGYPRSLIIEGDETERAATYEVAVDGSLAARPGDGAITPDDVSEVRTVEGSVTTRAHRYRFSGEVTFTDVRGPATILVDGEPTDPETGSVDPPLLGQRIIVDGAGTEGTGSYEFTVDGEARRSQEIFPRGVFDSVAKASVTGTVSDGAGGYRVSGTVRSLSVEGGAAISLGTAAK